MNKTHNRAVASIRATKGVTVSHRITADVAHLHLTSR